MPYPPRRLMTSSDPIRAPEVYEDLREAAHHVTAARSC
jgi:hypothetical protein